MDKALNRRDTIELSRYIAGALVGSLDYIVF